MAAGTGTALRPSAEGLRTVYLCQNYLFTDAAAHDPGTDAGLIGFADVRHWNGATIYLVSTLNAQTVVRLVAALDRVTAAALTVPQMAPDITLPAYTSGDPQRGAWAALHAHNSIWPPYLYVVINPAAAAAPSAGNLSIILYKTHYGHVHPDLVNT